MPWNQESPMNQRIKLVADWLSGNFTKSQLARRFDVSRPTVDKWIARHDGDLRSLSELSRRLHNSPNKTDDEILARVVAMKEAHDKWGRKSFSNYYGWKIPPSPGPLQVRPVNGLTDLGSSKSGASNADTAFPTHKCERPTNLTRRGVLTTKGSSRCLMLRCASL